MKHLAPIDPHVHLRGQEYDVNYVAKGLIDMRAAKIIGFCEMPNTKPAITDGHAILERVREVQQQKHDVGYLPKHGIHIGLTTDFDQVKSMLSFISLNKIGCYSDKTFYTHSTGNMGLLDEDLQRQIWKLKGLMNYKGVSIGHFEDEKLFTGEFKFEQPLTQSRVQNENAETKQVEKQIKNAFDAHFGGVFYVAHASSPDTVDFLNRARQTLPFKVVIEATFHHLFLNWDDYRIHGNLVKMNPPLRASERQVKLLSQLLEGKIDIIGTDHAPHPIERKLSTTPPSGIPALPFWPKAIDLLLNTYKMKPGHLAQLTFYAANDLFFGRRLKPTEVETEYDPTLWDQYGWNPFSRIDNSGVLAYTNPSLGAAHDEFEEDRMPCDGPEMRRGPGPRPQKLGL